MARIKRNQEGLSSACANILASERIICRKTPSAAGESAEEVQQAYFSLAGKHEALFSNRDSVVEVVVMSRGLLIGAECVRTLKPKSLGNLKLLAAVIAPLAARVRACRETRGYNRINRRAARVAS